MSDVERIRSLLDYDPDTGVFRWREAVGGRMAGQSAGTLHSKGYRRIKLDGRHHFAHRLAWLYVTGEWPDRAIDHMNGDKTDNRIANLRLATASENNMNMGVRRFSKTGLKGVSPQRKKYMAQISANGKRHYLGLFQTPEEAHQAYLQRARELHGDFARAE